MGDGRREDRGPTETVIMTDAVSPFLSSSYKQSSAAALLSDTSNIPDPSPSQPHTTTTETSATNTTTTSPSQRRRSSAAAFPLQQADAVAAGAGAGAGAGPGANPPDIHIHTNLGPSAPPPGPTTHASARRDTAQPPSHSNSHSSIAAAPLLPSTVYASTTLSAVNGATAPPRSHSHSHPQAPTSHPARLHTSRSPTSSPQRRPRPRSPQPPPPSSVAAPQIPSLPILPATVFSPSTPNTLSSNGSPSAGLFSYTSNPTTDYFSSKPQPAPAAQTSQRSPSRSKADKVLGRSPLGSPPIGVLESEARYKSSLANPRTAPPPRPTTSSTRETSQRPAPSTGREPAASKDQSSRYRSESNASARLDDSPQGTPPRSRERREKDKKTMLSRALAKANTAVLLDNAQNFEGAIEAYGDACRLLQQVMIRSPGEEDRRKLDAIRVTYTNRIEELRRQQPGYPSSGKSLPARPMSNESLDEQRSMLFGDNDGGDDDDDDEPAMIQTATMTRIVNDRSIDDDDSPSSKHLPFQDDKAGGVRESVISTAIRDVQRTIPRSSSFYLQPAPSLRGDSGASLGTPLESPMDRTYMPPPLSPRRPSSPLLSSRPDLASTSSNTFLTADRAYQPLHKRGNSNESTSWLDTIDESGGSSCDSSVHSLSPGGIRRKHLRAVSGNTDTDFDAAFDAAVEAAYDDGYEPYEEEDAMDTAESNTARPREIELAKERADEAERDQVIAAAKYHYAESQVRKQALPHVRESAEFDFQGEAEEEERLLDEMTREYMLEGFDFDLQTKSSLPRQSDSSGFSRSTHHSSSSSHRTTAGTSLSTVAEVTQAAPEQSPPPVPAPPLPLPPVPEPQVAAGEASEITPKPINIAKETASVRSRRLSGQNARTLKIETSLPPVPPAPNTDKPSVREKDPRVDVPQIPKTAAAAAFTTTQSTAESDSTFTALPQIPHPTTLRAPSPQPPIPSPADTAFTVSPATPALSHVMTNDTTVAPSSPKTGKGAGLGIKKNKSSLSLKQRTLSISSPDGSDASIGTPLSTTFSFTGARKQSATTAPAPTPSVPTFNVDGLPSGGMHLFESDIHSPYSPGSPSATVANAPIPLEPCPDSYLLRPFWLMRCFYQTIAHPRGGYLSTKLFIPRDVWRVKGVKLKNIDDKIANCDLLTAALQRLGTVDTLDADAVLEEMQALELVLDQVQTQLTKKLGNEVGVHGVSVLFKDASTVGIGSSTGDTSEKGSHGSQDHAPKSAVSQSKSYLTSWRKLRSKGSAVGLSSMAGGGKAAGGEVPKDSLTMATLPMTSLPNIRFAKRDVASVVFEGPNAGYMSSLARLFDAVQILDQIARQVEDPGLKHSSPTHVGLELSARHAAEFFGFYVCRFVLNDVTLMLDKFIKRGSEWVLV
ncbi:uncharacterized protein EI97DRAFT_435552 [Westerdykella ornata]|uniref:MIT domain-containing protein n=1 Tax=Westerdykella ornata TaxID=318751 RepID=A0A6A6JE22_WESOR|nr:uncharacterized protein EI97DRAFT_435552 [Westerdykella ornata]KAF2273906.1 hypothetical protein EI97DRAFT_435552 [Westerdykella ornata]